MELVVIIVLIGILAAVAIPRLPSRATFDALYAGDTLASMLRVAQKRAISRNELVHVFVDAAGGTVKACRDASSACADPLNDPGTSDPLRFVVPSGVTISGVSGYTSGGATTSVTSFHFDQVGRLVSSADAETTRITLSVTADSSTKVVKVWNETGFTELP